MPTPKKRAKLDAAVDLAATKLRDKFAAMEAKLKAGEFYEDVDDGLDELLGTSLEDRDREVEAAWEVERHGEL